jgi:VWFA-related protein
MVRRIPLVSGVLVAGLALLPQARTAGQGQSQTPTPPQLTFRAGTNFVEVDAVVTDAQGNFVRDLTAADFEVLEDGRPVRVDAFSLVDLPVGDAPAAPEAQDDPFSAEITTNEHDFEGRIYLIVLDANQISPLRTPHTRELARRFVVENMAGSDQAAVVHIGDDKISQDFTSNKRLLLDSIDRFTGQKLRSAVLNKYDDAAQKHGIEGDVHPVRDADAVERAAKARQTMASVRNLANYMAGIRGRRKALLLLSEGVSFNMHDTIGPGQLGYDIYRDNDPTEAQYAADVALDMQSMIETATRANVAVYSVDPRGLSSDSDEAMGLPGPLSDRLTGATSDADLAAHEGVIKGLREELNRSHTQLRSVSEQTGGLAIVNTNSFPTGFGNIVKDNSTYYLLGYNSDPKYDGKFHEITVRLKRQGLQVRARKGYYALKANPATTGGPAPDVLHDLLASPMPMSGLTMRVSSDVFKGTGTSGLVQVAVEIDGEELQFTEEGGTARNTVEMSYIAFDPSGTSETGGTKTLEFSLRPENREAVAEHGLRFATEIALPPGRYQIRLAAKEAVGGRSGSVFWNVDVPEFTAALAMSDVLVSSERAAAAPVVNDAATIKALFPWLTAAHRSFALEDTLSVFAEIYDNRAATPHDVTLSVAILADDGFELFKAEETKRSTDLSPDRGAYAYTTKIPLADLAPGRFKIRVEARSSLGGDPVVKEIAIEIR